MADDPPFNKKPLGPTFATELESAGLTGLPFAWSGVDGGLTFGENMTLQQKLAVIAVYAANDPNAPVPPQPLSMQDQIDKLVQQLGALSDRVTALKG